MASGERLVEPERRRIGSRFRYTGQIALPEAQLYHYKARVYDPLLGRFLQTDPVGYDDDLNLYAYTRNDPLNMIDVTGRDAIKLYDPHQAAGFGHVSAAFVSPEGRVTAYEFTGAGALHRYDIPSNFRADVDSLGNVTPTGVDQIANLIGPQSAGANASDNRGDYTATVFPDADSGRAFDRAAARESRAINDNGGPRVGGLTGRGPTYHLCTNNCNHVANKLVSAAGATGNSGDMAPNDAFQEEQESVGNEHWTQRGNAYQDPRPRGYQCPTGTLLCRY